MLKKVQCLFSLFDFSQKFNSFEENHSQLSALFGNVWRETFFRFTFQCSFTFLSIFFACQTPPNILTEKSFSQFINTQKEVGKAMKNFKDGKMPRRSKSISKFFYRSEKQNKNQCLVRFSISLCARCLDSNGLKSQRLPISHPPTPLQFLSLREWNFSLMCRQQKQK